MQSVPATGGGAGCPDSSPRGPSSAPSQGEVPLTVPEDNSHLFWSPHKGLSHSHLHIRRTIFSTDNRDVTQFSVLPPQNSLFSSFMVLSPSRHSLHPPSPAYLNLLHIEQSIKPLSWLKLGYFGCMECVKMRWKRGRDLALQPMKGQGKETRFLGLIQLTEEVSQLGGGGGWPQSYSEKLCKNPPHVVTELV